MIQQIKNRLDIKKMAKSLAFWVILAVILGVLVGFLSPALGIASKPGIEIFMKCLKWLVGPVIFFTIITGILGLESLKELGSIGAKAFLYFEVVSTFALAIGIGFANLLKPGVGMNFTLSSLNAESVAKVEEYAKNVKIDTSSHWAEIMQILKSAVPSDFNLLKPFITANTLQVLFMSIVLAIILAFLPNDKKTIVLKPLEKGQHFIFKVLNLFMWLSPIATFSAMAFLVGKFGLSSLVGMFELLLCMALACLTFIFGVLGVICYFAKINIFKFMRFIAKEVLVVFATSSSETALAPLMQKLERAGIHRGAVGLIMPTGYSFNLDCTNIYLAMSVIFLAQAFNIPLTLSHEISILILLMVTSKGAVGVTGSGIAVLTATLGSMHDVIPAITVSVLLGVDKFMSEMRAVGNLCGNAVACLIVSIWDKKVDLDKFRYALDHPEEFHK